MTEFARASAASRFLSLKWKALFLLSLVLIAINGVFYLLQSHHLEIKFKQNRDITRELSLKLIKGLFLDAASQLRQAGELVPLLSNMEAALISQDKTEITSAFYPHWPMLQVDQGVDSVAFFDNQGQLLATWGYKNLGSAVDYTLRELITNASESERPRETIQCYAFCMQFVAVPLLVDGDAVGSILLGAALAQPIIQFNRLTKTDIGIIVPFEEEKNSGVSRGRFIPSWEAKVIALTRIGTLLPVIRTASENHPLSSLLDRELSILYQSHHYETRLFPLSNFKDQNTGYFFFIDEITDEVEEINVAKQEAFTVGVIGLVLSEMALLIILWHPLSRLRRTASALPMLARQDYDAARSLICEKPRMHYFADEIEQLDSTALFLTSKLESLNAAVSDRTAALAEKVTELAKERDFVNGLLNTAQVIIITLDIKGNIRLSNKFARRITGYLSAEIEGRLFSDVIACENSYCEQVMKQIGHVSKGKRKHYQHESKLICKDKTMRDVAWLHSHVGYDNDEGPVMLSVGLDITARKQAERHVAWLADHDPLTGLYNRRRFNCEFEKVVKLAQRYKRVGALLFLDLDHFKYINDTLGHNIGDMALKNVSNELRALLRASDIIARLGGDEFAVLMPEVDRDAAIAVAEKINTRFRGFTLPGLSNRYQITTSIGLALFPEHGTTVDELLANADMAMYQVKEHRRGEWHLFSKQEQARERFQKNVHVKNLVELALAEDRFMLEYQPIFDVRSGEIVHYEVLLRMLDEEGQSIRPKFFIEVAEKSGLIHSIDHLVLRKSFSRLEELGDQNSSLTLAINLSAHAFNDLELLPLLKELLETSHVRTEQLIFEITETAALADFSAACTLIETLQKMGCRFALDDFGVGFSSFYYLKQLPVDFVKIDGSFIQYLPTNRDDQILVKAISDIAKGFGKQIIAEFVEDEETLKMLRGYEVNYAQGYYLGRPENLVA